MIWKSIEGLRVEIVDEAFCAIKKHIASRKRGETGGILIGQYSPDHFTAEVLSASGPGRQSLFGLFSFTRRAFGLQEELDKEFDMGRYYLGEWHCHPGSHHTPSFQDIQQMHDISKSHCYNCPEPILLVVGRDDPTQYISVLLIKDGHCHYLERDNNGRN